MAIEFEDEFMDDADFAALDAAMQVCIRSAHTSCVRDSTRAQQHANFFVALLCRLWRRHRVGRPAWMRPQCTAIAARAFSPP